MLYPRLQMSAAVASAPAAGAGVDQSGGRNVDLDPGAVGCQLSMGLTQRSEANLQCCSDACLGATVPLFLLSDQAGQKHHPLQ